MIDIEFTAIIVGALITGFATLWVHRRPSYKTVVVKRGKELHIGVAVRKGLPGELKVWGQTCHHIARPDNKNADGPIEWNLFYEDKDIVWSEVTGSPTGRTGTSSTIPIMIRRISCRHRWDVKRIQASQDPGIHH